MSKVKVVNSAGKPSGELDIPDALLEQRRGSQAVHDVVVNSLAVHRAATASTLRKGEVSGSNRKPWRQKGTGRARAGLRQSPVWRGGGVAFGPHPRAFGGRINKKVARLAFRRIFSDKVADESLVVLETLSVEQAKTKLLAGILKALGFDGAVLIVVEQRDRNLSLAARNIPTVEVAVAREVSVYQLARYPRIVVTRGAMGVLQQRLSQGVE